MITIVLLNLISMLFVYKICSYIFYRPPNFPPGPPRIPWFGSYIFMLLLNRKHLHLAVNQLCKFYKSSVIGMYLGETPVIVLNDSENVKKLLNHRDFDGKADILLGRLRDPNFGLFGIFFTDGQLWFEQRRFTLRYLRDFGFGRRFDILEQEIQTQIEQYIEMIKYGAKYPHEMEYCENGKILLPGGFGPIFGNCFFAVLFNETIPREDMADLYKAAERALLFQRKSDNYGKLFSLIPLLTKIFPNKSDYKQAREASLQIHSYFKKLIDEQIKTFDENHERHFIDMYINQMRKTGPETMTSFTIDQLILTCIDFSFPVFGALPATTTFLIQQICHEPDVQRKIHTEIDRVVGSGRKPTLDDRINLPYTEACIREIMRYETLVPSGLPHESLVDTQFLGYDIPKGTCIMPALNAASHDDSVWDAPHKFMPERFLDENGMLSLQKDISVPFGAGKRLCAGETFARNMLFLFVSSLLQAFSVSIPAGEAVYSFEDNLTGMIRTTQDHWIQMKAR